MANWITIGSFFFLNVYALIEHSCYFKTSKFHRWANGVGLCDVALYEAIQEIERGIIGDSLGGKLYQKRYGLPNQGKSGGCRLFVALNDDDIYFIDGYMKKDRKAILRTDLPYWKQEAKYIMGSTFDERLKAVEEGSLIAINHDPTSQSISGYGG